MDLTALEQPPTSEQRNALLARRKAGEFGEVGDGVVGLVVAIVSAAAALGMLVGFVSMAAALWRQAASRPGAPWPLLVPFVALPIIAAGGMVMTIVRMWPRHDAWLPLALLADANGRRFRLRDANPSYPGMVFGLGSDRTAATHVYSPEDRLADVGRFTWTTGSGDNETTHAVSFAAYRLSRDVPHLVLDSRRNNGMFSSLPVRYQSSQRISLGSPFDDEFIAYAPDGYAPDAFHVFSPDVMEALVHVAPRYDIELVDDWLFCYFEGSASLRDPARWRELEWIGDAIAERVASGSYVDRRAAAPSAPAAAASRSSTVAPQGRRLRRSWWRTAVAVAGFVLLWLLFRVGLVWFGDAFVPR